LTGYATEEYVDRIATVIEGPSGSGSIETTIQMMAAKDSYTPSTLTLYNDEGYSNSATLTAGDAFVNVVDDESIKSNEHVTISFKHPGERSPSLVLSRQDDFEGHIDTSFEIFNVDSATINRKEIATQEYVDKKTAGYKHSLIYPEISNEDKVSIYAYETKLDSSDITTIHSGN
jgi:hypothetical protein